jgi:hypothetical protein
MLVSEHNISSVVQSNLDYPNLDYPIDNIDYIYVVYIIYDYPNSRCNEKCRVKVQIVVTCPRLRMHSKLTSRIRVVITRAPAAAWLLSLVLSLKEVKEMQDKCSINQG